MARFWALGALHCFELCSMGTRSRTRPWRSCLPAARCCRLFGSAAPHRSRPVRSGSWRSPLCSSRTCGWIAYALPLQGISRRFWRCRGCSACWWRMPCSCPPCFLLQMCSDGKHHGARVFGALANPIVPASQAMRRLAILIEAGCPICPSRPLDHWAAEALGQLPCLESLALANVCVGDHLLQALHGSVTLCALSLEGDHGATLPGICGLLRARGRAGAGLLEELQLTAGLTCQVDDAVLLCFARLGITYLTLEGANISKDGIRRCAGLQAIRAKSCGELDLLPPVARLGPPPRKKKPGPSAAKALKAKTDGGLASGWDVRLLGSDQQLCHWWQKGYRYDDMSWYGLEHA
ncbi:unnamed protein product [Effrenium voratum]|nr:unnamed protein product [Effrenium voratum]